MGEDLIGPVSMAASALAVLVSSVSVALARQARARTEGESQRSSDQRADQALLFEQMRVVLADMGDHVRESAERERQLCSRIASVEAREARCQQALRALDEWAAKVRLYQLDLKSRLDIHGIQVCFPPEPPRISEHNR